MTKSLAAIGLIYLALTLAYAMVVPLWEAPDEPAHFLYVNAIAETGQPPAPSPPQRNSFWKEGYVTSVYEWYQPPLYYALAAPVVAANRSFALVPSFSGFPEINSPFPLAVRLFVAQPFRFAEIHLLRILSALIGLATVFTVYVMARRLFPQEKALPALAAGFVAFIPQFNFLHAYITNDTLAILLSTLGLTALVSVALASPETQRRAWAWAGSVVSLALATKMTTWFLLPVAGLLALSLLSAKTRRWPVLLGDITLFGALVLIVPLLSWLVWPDLLERLFHSPQSGGFRSDFASLGHFTATILPLTHSSFWGRFGWMNVLMEPYAVLILDGIGVIGLVSAAFFLWKDWRGLLIGQRLGVILLLTGFVFVSLLFVVFNLTTVQPQGRYFFPALATIGIFVALGWVRLAGRWRSWVVGLLLAGMVGVNLMVLARTILPAYAL